MTRIVAGRYGGRALRVPKQGTRPTTERVREAVMNSLQHRFGSWDSIRVLELFAGSGAMGIEALSRGAAWTTFVESAPGAVRVLRANLAALGAGDASVEQRDVLAYLHAPNRGEPFDVVVADPPYGYPRLGDCMAALSPGGWLAPEAIVVVETGRRDPEPWVGELIADGRSDYGDTSIWYGRRQDRQEQAPRGGGERE